MKFFHFLLIFISINCSGQQIVNKICNSTEIKYDSSIKVFIKGKEKVNEIENKFFQQEFELTSKDDSTEIIFFRITVDSWNLIVIRSNNGKKIEPDYIEDGVDKGKDYSLRALSAGSYIYFDNIVVKKGDACFKASPLALKIK